MSAKHTPGPWLNIGDRSNDSSVTPRIKTESGWVDMTFSDFCTVLAAPDLLKALKSLIDMPEYDLTAETSRIRREAKRLARAAIAKAEGGAA